MQAPVEKTTSLAVNLTEEEKTILEYNQRIAVFNRAPADYPSFIRNGSSQKLKCVMQVVLLALVVYQKCQASGVASSGSVPKVSRKWCC
jgi:hypothetical protein